MGASKGHVSVRGVVCFVLLRLLLLDSCAIASSRWSFGYGGARVGAYKATHHEDHSESNLRRTLLSDETGLPLQSLELNLENATVNLQYMNNTELELAMRNFTQRCSHISRLYSIGNSTQGVPLWVIEISDRPGDSEPKPAFKYVGNMHGDEPLGRELVLLLADWLCDNYLKDSLATMIVNKVHLHLLPSMNPDGFAASPHPSRNNPHDVDLNRDFPDQFFPQNNNEELRQPETRAIMRWIRATRFTASASFHEGALVANYPYDGTHDTSARYALSPDDSTFRYLAGVYSKNHPLMSKSKEFVDGVTNGAAWYPLYGGMQDWNYLHGNCLELTLEMNEDKWPPPYKVPQIWREHRMSLLQLIAATVTSGVHGRVMSSAKAQPLTATISVRGIDHPITASAEFGHYYRLLAPGNAYEGQISLYSVTASMVGYDSRTTTIILPKDKPVTFDFILDPIPTNLAMVGRSRLRGQDRLDKNGTLKKVPQQTALGRPMIVNHNLHTAHEELPDLAMWNQWRLDDSTNESWYVMTLQLRLSRILVLIAVSGALVYVVCRSRGGHRYQIWRQRVSRRLQGE